MRKFYECDLEEIIYTADREELEERGLNISSDAKLLRQVRIGNYGVADLIKVEKIYAVDNEPYLNITVIELKEDKVGISAFLQAVGYVKGIHSYLTRVRDFYSYKVGIWLIGSSIDTSGSFCYLSDMIKCNYDFTALNDGEIDFYDTYIYDYKIDGILFVNKYGYKLTDEGF